MRQILNIYQIQYNTMENEEAPHPRTPPLEDLLARFLREPSPEIELQLTRSAPTDLLDIIANSSQPKEIKLAAITTFKAASNNRQAYQGTVASVQALFLSAEEELCSPIQMLLETLFQLYLDDEKKLAAFERAVDTLSNNSRITACKMHQRALRIALLLVRAMAAPSLNNEICIGGLVCYLKQLYYAKNITNDPQNVSGRGMELLHAAMGSSELDPALCAWVEVQVSVVQLMREIVLRVEEEECEEPQVLPSLYLSRSHEVQSLLSGIISASVSGKLLCAHESVNHLKAQLLQLYAQNYLYRISQPFLVAALSTITSLRASSLQDYTQQAVSTLLLLIERSTSHPDYAQQFFSVTQTLVLKLFELVASGNAEREAMEHDPEYFAEIADDFCKTQDADTVKSRAGSLLYNLAMYVDGNLTFITNLALLPLLDLERRALTALRPDTPPRPECLRAQIPMRTFLQLWPNDAQSITETSILVLASISDLLTKRNQFNNAIRNHLLAVLPLFAQKEQALSFFPKIVICRYLTLVSFFSAPNCLDPFIALYSAHPAIAQSVLRALQTVIHFYDKKDERMRNYVASVSTRVLLLSDTLTPLLQSTIISRPELLLCVKERLLEKLVLWLLKYLQNVNVFAANKIGNLICKLLEKYPDYLLQSEEQLYDFELEALAGYLSPLYRHLLTSEHHEAEECVVEVAVSHCEVLKTGLTARVAMEFLQLGVQVVTRNHFVLNKCLELFSRLLATPHANLLPQNKQQPLTQTWLAVANDLLPRAHAWLQKVQPRDENIWQIAYLMEIILAAFASLRQTPPKELLDCSLLIEKSKTLTRVVQIKATMVALLSVLLDEGSNPAQEWLAHGPLPLPLPPYQSNRICILAIRALPRFQNNQARCLLLNYILSLLLPTPALRKYFAVYADQLHCGSPHECEIFAFQAEKEVLHPLSCWPSDPFDELRTMLNHLPNWRTLAVALGVDGEKKLRQALSMRVVGAKLRQIVKVKPLKL